MKILDETHQTDLVTRLVTGDERAFDAIYLAYSRPMFLRMMYLVKDADIVEELLQELFIRLWTTRGGLDPEKSFQSYMYTIAQNLVYNHFRKIANEQSMINSLLGSQIDHYLNGEELLENKQTAELIERSIVQLSPQQQQAFRLCKIEGRSREETSHIMGISETTVNSHMTKAIKSVKDYLIKHYDITILLILMMNESHLR